MSNNQDKTSQDPIQHWEHAERLSNLANNKPAEINREIGLNLFKDMTLGRRFEDKCAEMYYRGKMFWFCSSLQRAGSNKHGCYWCNETQT